MLKFSIQFSERLASNCVCVLNYGSNYVYATPYTSYSGIHLFCNTKDHTFTAGGS